MYLVVEYAGYTSEHQKHWELVEHERKARSRANELRRQLIEEAYGGDEKAHLRDDDSADFLVYEVKTAVDVRRLVEECVLPETLAEDVIEALETDVLRTEKEALSTSEAEMDWNRIWEKLNNSGMGYPVGAESDAINEIDGVGTLVKRARTSDDVAVYAAGDHYVVVGDANGPWAVDCPAEDLALDNAGLEPGPEPGAIP